MGNLSAIHWVNQFVVHDDPQRGVNKSDKPIISSTPNYGTDGLALIWWAIYPDDLGFCLTMTGVVLVNARQADTVATIAE